MTNNLKKNHQKQYIDYFFNYSKIKEIKYV